METYLAVPGHSIAIWHDTCHFQLSFVERLYPSRSLKCGFMLGGNAVDRHLGMKQVVLMGPLYLLRLKVRVHLRMNGKS